MKVDLEMEMSWGGDGFGGSIANLGDLDGDGVQDIAVGEYLNDDGGDSNGAVWILFLNTSGGVKTSYKINESRIGNGNELNDSRFGISIANLGDLDGDGIQDIAVGEYLNDDGGDSNGAVWILFLNTSGGVKSEYKINESRFGNGNELGGDGFGGSIANLGDLDGDGVQDIAVGEFLNDDGGTKNGAVWILYLNTSGGVKSEYKINESRFGNGDELNSGQFGFSIANLGDLNNDGVQDLAVGEIDSNDGGLNNGAVWILSLGEDVTSPLITYTSGTPSTNSNQTNGDIFVNVSVSEVNEDTITFLIYNSTAQHDSQSFTNATRNFNFTSLADDTYTFNVTVNDTNGNVNTVSTRTVVINSTLADVNFTGPSPFSGDIVYDDIIVNLSFMDAVNATIFLSNASKDVVNTSTSLSSTFFLNFTNLSSGVYFYNASAINVNGLVNFTLTRNLLLINPNLTGDGSVNKSYKINATHFGNGSELSGDNFGTSIANLGDLDGDGVQDIVVGAPLDDDGGGFNGAVWILFLNESGGVKSEYKINESRFGNGDELGSDFFGISVANIGDLDGDGVQDIAVGENDNDDGGDRNGAVWILFLNTSGGVKSEYKINESRFGNGNELNGSAFGGSVASIGDLDGDGVQDIAVGEELNDEGGNNNGALWILFLNTSGGVKSEYKINESRFGNGNELSGDFFGTSVANLGDLNGDGVQDIVVGALSNSDGGASNGAVWILFLNTSGGVSSEYKINVSRFGNGSELNGDVFGNSVANLGDLNNDGIQDIAVGGRGNDDGGDNNGAVWILFLNKSGGVKSEYKINSSRFGNGSELSGDQFSQGIASLGDLNNDGIQDIVVGEYLNDDGGDNNGAIWILFLDENVSIDISNPALEGEGEGEGGGSIRNGSTSSEMDFTVSKSKINVGLIQGDSEIVELRIINTENSDQNFELDIDSSIREFVNLSESIFSLSANEEKIFYLEFMIGSESELGEYIGNLNVKGIDRTKEVLITIEVKEVVRDFIIDKEIIEIKVVQGYSKNEYINIINSEDVEQTFNLVLSSDLGGFVTISENRFILGPGEFKNISLNIKTDFDSIPFVHTGNIKINGKNKEKEIFILLTIKESSVLIDGAKLSPSILFDVILTIDDKYKELKKGDNLLVNVTIINLGDSEKINVQVNYKIKNFNNNDIVIESEKVVVDSKIIYSKEIELSELISEGFYAAIAEVEYEDSLVSSSSVFNVVKQEYNFLEFEYFNGEFKLLNISLLEGNYPTLSHDPEKEFNMLLISKTGEVIQNNSFDSPSIIFSDLFEGEEIEGGLLNIGKSKFYAIMPESEDSYSIKIFRDQRRITEEEVFDVGAKSCRLK